MTIKRLGPLSFPGFKNTYPKSTDKAWLNLVTSKLAAKALHNTEQPLLNIEKHTRER